MPGAVIFLVAMVLVVPVGVMLAGAIFTFLFGWLAGEDAVKRAAGTSAGEAEGRAGAQ